MPPPQQEAKAEAAAPITQQEVEKSEPVPKDFAALLAAIPPPANEIEKAAFEALEKGCARCHQVGKLEGRVKPAKGFGNILDLRAIAANPGLVIRGNPDGSTIVKQILSGNMPYDIQEGGFGHIPSKEEVQSIRVWITSLKDADTGRCKERDFITFEDVVSAIADDVEKEQPSRVKGNRYITLTNLYNACADDTAKIGEMEVYRNGVVKLLNYLSRNSDPLKIQAVDEAGTVLKFNLDDLSWTPADWEKIIAVYPYGVRPDIRKYDFLTQQFDTKVPFIRGDWLAFTASRPPLYYDLLKLPKTFQELEKQVGVDTLANIKNFLVKRSGFQRSLVSQNNRLIERHQISTGYFWTSYDFSGNKSNQSLFEFPLGPGKDEKSFHHDGGETIFSLPNGLNGYYLNTADGKRLDKGPTEIVRDQDRKDLAVTNAISCFGCHDNGIRLSEDDIRKHVIDDPNFSKDVREQVERMYPPIPEMTAQLKDDAARFRAAMERAGLDPNLRGEGQKEPINALSNHYERDIDLRLAASELGLTVDEFTKTGNAKGGEPGQVLRRLEQATIPRDNFEARFQKLIPEFTDNEPIAVAAGAAAEVAKVNEGDAKVDGEFNLALFADKTDYATNELPVFTVQSDADCNLTLINVDGKGVGTVLYPNKFQQENALKAKQAFQFPAADAPFQFRMKDPGNETIIALCNSKGRGVDLIEHNFKTDAFTNLGDYESLHRRQDTPDRGRSRRCQEGREGQARR